MTRKIRVRDGETIHEAVRRFRKAICYAIGSRLKRHEKPHYVKPGDRRRTKAYLALQRQICRQWIEDPNYRQPTSP